MTTAQDRIRQRVTARRPPEAGPPPDPPAPDPAGREWPAPPDAEAFAGPAGEYVRAAAPSTEADPAGVPLQLLVLFGNLVGRSAHMPVGADRHHANEFLTLVGDTAGGRKGSSGGVARAGLRGADDDWLDGRLASGLSSGEGLIWFVRDPIERRVPVREKGKPTRYEVEVADEGVCDKRAVAVESEFVSVLKQAERQGNTLSSVLRQAWDGTTLQTLTKNSPARASNAHVSVIGHITEAELKRYLSEVETANGFGNRFLWAVVRRSGFLPDAPPLDTAAAAGPMRDLSAAAAAAKDRGAVGRDAEAQGLWREVYPRLEADRPGLAGALLARAAPHVNRLSLIYPLTERAESVRTRYLMAALALWDYCERSVGYLFGDSTGDRVADDALALIRRCPDGINRSDIRDYFGRNVSSDRLSLALGLLLRLGRVERREVGGTGGRPAERWFPVRGRAA